MRLIIFILLIVFHSSCKEKSEVPVDCSDPNYVLSADGTSCDCPNDHFVVTNKFDSLFGGLPDCIKKNDYNYFVKADNHNCFSSGDFMAFDEVGLARFDTAKGTFLLKWGDMYGLRPEGDSFFKPIDYILNSDGSFSVSYEIRNVISRNCKNWKDLTECPDLIVGKASGESNSDHSEVNFEILWVDCDNIVIDTGKIKMWRDW